MLLELPVASGENNTVTLISRKFTSHGPESNPDVPNLSCTKKNKILAKMPSTPSKIGQDLR